MLCAISIRTLFFHLAITIEAASVNLVQTNGSIEFYGESGSRSEPEPIPPTGPIEETALPVGP